MANDKVILYTLNEYNTKQIFSCDDRSQSTVGLEIVQLDYSHFNDVLCSKSFLQPSINLSDHSFR